MWSTKNASFYVYGREEESVVNGSCGDRREGEGIYFQFLQAIEKAIAKSALVNMAIIQKAAKEGTWQASAWIMERRHKYHAKQEPEVIVQIDAKEASITQLIQQVKETDLELETFIADPVIDLDE